MTFGIIVAFDAIVAFVTPVIALLLSLLLSLSLLVAWRTPLEFQYTPKSTPFQSCFIFFVLYL
jgi:hypothetical protein